jgi:hypothetical protein
MCAGQSMLCPYQKAPLRFARGASAIEERFLAAFRARKQRARGKNTRNSPRNDDQMKGKAPIERLAGECCTSMGRGCTLSVGWESVWAPGISWPAVALERTVAE